MFVSTFLVRLLAAVGTASARSVHLNYSVVPGIFLQDDPNTDPATFDFIATNFGLINRTYDTDSIYPDRQHATQWQRLNFYISILNKKAKHAERYVLLFLSRHGEGFHNAAETYFGTPAWNCYWSERDGNGTIIWADAKLTDSGISQAQTLNRFWRRLIRDENIVPPETFYTSPLYRSLATADLNFKSLPLPRKNPFVPVVKEDLREGVSAHTCDRRSTKTYIHKNFPSYQFERGFPENDPYWAPLRAETSDAQDIRSKKVLDDIFLDDDSTYISVTSHSGEIASLLRVLGHRVFGLNTAAALPVLVKVTTLHGNSPYPNSPKPTPVQTCAAAPTIRDSSCNDCSCCLQVKKKNV